MAKYQVHCKKVQTFVVDVEADTEEEALSAFHYVSGTDDFEDYWEQYNTELDYTISIK